MIVDLCDISRNKSNREFFSQWLGLQEYSEALSIQLKTVESVRDSNHQIQVLGCEHTNVITLGVRGELSTDILGGSVPDGFAIHRVNRGGQAVLHNPGQLVIYPIIDLRATKISVKDWLCILSKVSRDCLKELGIDLAEEGPEPGLYTHDGEKVVYFGIRVDRGVAYHGLAINVSNNLADFSLIKSCGVNQQKTTKIMDIIQSEVSCESIFDLWMIFLKKHLQVLS